MPDSGLMLTDGVVMLRPWRLADADWYATAVHDPRSNASPGSRLSSPLPRSKTPSSRSPTRARRSGSASATRRPASGWATSRCATTPPAAASPTGGRAGAWPRGGDPGAAAGRHRPGPDPDPDHGHGHEPGAPQRAGMASATSNTARELGGAVGVAVLGSVLTSRMTSALQQRLAGIGLPASVRDQLVHTAGQGARGSAFSRPLPAAVRAALNAAFVDGLHVAECAGAIVLAGTALFAAILVRRAQQPQPPGRGPLQTRPRTNTL